MAGANPQAMAAEEAAGEEVAAEESPYLLIATRLQEAANAEEGDALDLALDLWNQVADIAETYVAALEEAVDGGGGEPAEADTEEASDE